ncbi:ABC transporter substrate-binding protein [Erwinia sp. V71]|uniref:ABC transporter substrate-binding protein n=1 Tax=Erwinia sp. V71 TaxID=3369424 RepID=UPI003F60CAFB
MKTLRCYLLILFAFSGSAHARTVVDHAGYQVTLPEQPQRIVSLHDWTLTVMVHELGAPLVASTGRLAADGTFYIRGARELFGLDFSQLVLASVHGKLDPERIRALKPDVILANTGDYLAVRDTLSTIAPVVYFNPEQDRPMLELYHDLASWLGRDAEFSALTAHYQQKVAGLRQQHLQTDHPLSYIALLVNGRDGTIQVLKEYGALTTVMDDLGLQRMPVARSLSAGRDRVTISPELIELIDADYIVTSYLPDQGEDASNFARDMDRVAPGARQVLKAFRHGRIINLSRFEVYPPSVRGLESTLSSVEKVIVPVTR